MSRCLKVEAFPFDGSIMFRRLVLASALLLAPVASQADSAADAAQRLETLSKLVQDPHPRVRLEALRSLAKIHGARSAELALGVLDQTMDPTLDYALWLTINELSEPWIAALESGAWKSEGREKQLAFALKAIRPDQSSRVLGRVIQERRLPRDGSGPWIELIGQAGGPKELGALLQQTVSGGFDDGQPVFRELLRIHVPMIEEQLQIDIHDARCVVGALNVPGHPVQGIGNSGEHGRRLGKLRLFVAVENPGVLAAATL